ncbi:MAG: M16 family metallopeptidase, partial [Planctomycetia bacterium]
MNVEFRTHRLANGLEIVAECNPHARSAAVGFFVRAGSRDETPEIAGVSHFLEHMAFKGTDARSAMELNRAFDAVGAKNNAFTSEEHTVYHAAVLPEYLPTVVDLMGDLIRPSLRQEDFDVEKKVILEEIAMYADSPVMSAYEVAMRRHFGRHPLGNSVLGTIASISELPVDRMRAYHAKRYGADNVLLAASGKVDFNQLVDLAEARCGAWRPGGADRSLDAWYESEPHAVEVRSEFQQETVVLISRAPDATDERRYAADLLSSVLGDDTGSRLYWELIEPGEADGVDLGYHEYEGAGCFLFSMSCEPERTQENMIAARRILNEVLRSPITADEL